MYKSLAVLASPRGGSDAARRLPLAAALGRCVRRTAPRLRPTARSTRRRLRASTASFATSTRATRRRRSTDRFAVYGVARVRPARDAAELAAALRRLVEPLGPGLVAQTLPAAPHPRPASRSSPGGPRLSTMGGAYRASARIGSRPRPRDAGGVTGSALCRRSAEAWRAPTSISARAEGRARPCSSPTPRRAPGPARGRPRRSARRSGRCRRPGATPDQRFADVVVVWNVFRHFYRSMGR